MTRYLYLILSSLSIGAFYFILEIFEDIESKLARAGLVSALVLLAVSAILTVINAFILDRSKTAD